MVGTLWREGGVRKGRAGIVLGSGFDDSSVGWSEPHAHAHDVLVDRPLHPEVEGFCAANLSRGSILELVLTNTQRPFKADVGVFQEFPAVVNEVGVGLEGFRPVGLVQPGKLKTPLGSRADPESPVAAVNDGFNDPVSAATDEETPLQTDRDADLLHLHPHAVVCCSCKKIVLHRFDVVSKFALAHSEPAPTQHEVVGFGPSREGPEGGLRAIVVSAWHRAAIQHRGHELDADAASLKIGGGLST